MKHILLILSLLVSTSFGQSYECHHVKLNRHHLDFDTTMIFNPQDTLSFDKSCKNNSTNKWMVLNNDYTKYLFVDDKSVKSTLHFANLGTYWLWWCTTYIPNCLFVDLQEIYINRTLIKVIDSNTIYIITNNGIYDVIGRKIK